MGEYGDRMQEMLEYTDESELTNKDTESRREDTNDNTVC